ncbi:hypothetical protein M0802_012341 [Mischocyttarus mexicanus]|nr:hypothetical protein M0802_012341 [Mischocyttarus mexicanus]
MTVQKFKPRGSNAAEDQRPTGDILLSASNEPLENDKEQCQSNLQSLMTDPPSPRNLRSRSTSQPQQLTQQQQQQQQQDQRQDSSENLLGRVLAGKLINTPN